MNIDPINLQQSLISPQYAPVYNVTNNQEIARVAPALAQRLVELIQESLNNPPRIFFFNQIAANGYQNQLFVQMLTKACDLAEMVAMTRRGSLQGLDDYLVQYVQYKIADQLSNPYLANFVDQNTINMAASLKNNFLNAVDSLERNCMAVMGNQSFGRQQMPGRQFDFQSTSGGSNAINRVFSENPRMGVSEPSRIVSRWSDTDRKTTDANTTERSNVPSKAPETPVTEIDLNPNLTFKNKSGVTTMKMEPSDNSVVTPKTEIAFQRSDGFPYDIAYTPSLQERHVEIVRGVIRVYFSKRIPMDRNAHLGRTNTMPKLVKPIKFDDMIRRQNAAKEQALEQQREGMRADIDIYSLYCYRDSLETAIATAQTHELATRTNGDRVSGSALRVGVFQAVNAGYDMRPFINDLIACKTTDLTVERIAAEIDASGTDYARLSAIRQVNARLTDHVNRYIKQKACLEYGDITDYFEDVLEMMTSVLSDYYGKSVWQNFIDHHPQIVREALSMEVVEEMELMLQSEVKIDDVIVEDEVEQEDVVDPNIVCFVELTAITAVNISSAELCFELPNKVVAVQVKESETALLYGVISSIYEKLSSTGSLCARNIVLLSDGVKLEVTRGAFNPDAYLVYLLE